MIDIASTDVKNCAYKWNKQHHIMLTIEFATKKKQTNKQKNYFEKQQVV